jgi:hypothetical protein
MSSHLKKVARLLKVDEAQARAFCLDVQKQIKSNPPSFQIIARWLEKCPEDRRDPSHIAQLLKKSPVSHASRERGKTHHPKGDRVITYEPGFDSIKPFSPALLHDPREFTERFAKCPHGVPITGICHICKGGKIDY